MKRTPYVCLLVIKLLSIVSIGVSHPVTTDKIVIDPLTIDPKASDETKTRAKELLEFHGEVCESSRDV